MTVRHLGDLVIYLGAIAAALGTIGALLRWGFIKPLKRWLIKEIGVPLDKARLMAVDTNSKAAAIEAEVSHNHGSSLKDAVVRTEIAVDTLTLRFDDHLKTHH
jgi:hypothetical protein